MQQFLFLKEVCLPAPDTLIFVGYDPCRICCSFDNAHPKSFSQGSVTTRNHDLYLKHVAENASWHQNNL